MADQAEMKRCGPKERRPTLPMFISQGTSSAAGRKDAMYAQLRTAYSGESSHVWKPVPLLR